MAVASAFHSLITNTIFLSTVSSLCFTQITKMVLYLVSHKNKSSREAIETAIWRTGGMPSSHSAVVCALTTSTGLSEGISSNLFVFCLIFTMVVLRDALGVRRAAGLQAKALNTLGKMTADKIGLEFQSVKEIQGHTPLEVLVGAVLGIAIAIGFYLLDI
ncbi:MAG: divergent PAP2 family protein [Treponema sp.]|nr:divergent PAP2 family protein [Treponema sp.]